MKKFLKAINFLNKKISCLKIIAFVFVFFGFVIFSTPTVNADITTGLVAHYNLNETSGTTASDSTGTNNGTVTGANWTSGKINNSLSFNGTTNYVSVPLMNYDEITVSAWFYKNANDTVNADAIWGGWRWNSAVPLREGFDIRFFQSAPNTIELQLATTNGTVKTSKASTYNMVNSTNAWHHVVGAYSKITGEQKLYVDGVLRDTDLHVAGNTIVPLTYYTDMRIGHSRINNGYFNGRIDDVRVYNRALSASDVVELYNLSSPTAVTNVAANITSSSATLSGTVNPNGLAVAAFFEYGTESGSYPNKTTNQNLSASPNGQNITANINDLIGNTNYYYRAVVSNSMGTSYGAEQSFFTTQTVSDFFPPPQNFGVGISFTSPTDPAAFLYWTAPIGEMYPPFKNYEIENLGEWGPVSLSDSTLNYTDDGVLNGTYYIYEIVAVYKDAGTITYKSEPTSILIQVPTAEECQCGVWKNCPYQTNVGAYKYAVDFMSQLQMPPGTSVTNIVPASLPAGNYRVKLVSAFKNAVDLLDDGLNSRWYVKLINGGVQIGATSPSSNFSDIDSYPYYAFKNEIVDESFSVPATTELQGEWTGSSSAYCSAQTYNYINAVCAYFEKIDPDTGLPYPDRGQVSIDLTATPNPVNNGSGTVLSWTSSNAGYCSASGGWSGSKDLSGAETTAPIYGTTIFNLKCVSVDGESEASKSVSVDVNPSENTIISMDCQPSPKIANIGQEITWTANPVPLSNSYTYSWSGDDNLSGSGQTVIKSYSTTGTKTGIVDVGGASNPQQCIGKVRITASPSFDEL